MNLFGIIIKKHTIMGMRRKTYYYTKIVKVRDCSGLYFCINRVMGSNVDWCRLRFAKSFVRKRMGFNSSATRQSLTCVKRPYHARYKRYPRESRQI